VTLVFTDIEGSTRLLEKLGVDGYREALAEHRRVVREACARHAGYEVSSASRVFPVPPHRLAHGRHCRQAEKRSPPGGLLC
jgi:class 3 adenylate cyclase